jgi:short-subunit dehydrogenase
MEISGRTVLLTGATGGLGGTIARDMSRAGAQLVLSGRRTELLEALAGELRARVVIADLGEPSDLDRLVQEAGAIDILIANAGLPGSGRLLDLSTDEIDRALDVNLRAPIMLTRALVTSS